MSNGPGGQSTRGSHKLSQPLVCPRKWYLRQEKHLVPNVEVSYFVEGRLAHIALAYYRAAQLHKMGRPVPSWFFERTLVDCLNEAGAGSPDAVKLGMSILNAYAVRWGSVDTWEPISIEEEYSATLGQIRRLINPRHPAMPDDEERFSSRIDLLVRNNGFLYAPDYKTTKRAAWSRKEWELPRLEAFNYNGEHTVSFQFMLQTAILRVNFGTEFRGVIVERILKAEPHDFDRTVVPIHNRMFADLPSTLAACAKAEREAKQMVADAVHRGEDMEMWLPPGHYWSCYSGGQMCEYKQICVAETPRQRSDIMVGEYHESST